MRRLIYWLASNWAADGGFSNGGIHQKRIVELAYVGEARRGCGPAHRMKPSCSIVAALCHLKCGGGVARESIENRYGKISAAA